MQGFHRLMASKSRQLCVSSCFVGNNQQKKEISHNEDDQYLMQVEEKCSSEGNRDVKQSEDDQNGEIQVDPLDAFMNNLQKSDGWGNKQQGVGSGSKRQTIIKEELLSIQKQQSQNFGLNNYSLQDSNDQQKYNYSLGEGRDMSNMKEDDSNNMSQGEENRRFSDHEEIYQSGQDQGDRAIPKLAPRQKKIIESLKPFDFSKIKLEDFQKDLYNQHPDISRLTENDVKLIRKQMQMKVIGDNIPKPIISFGHLYLDEKIKQVISKQQFEKPTPIQSQALPIALSGKDMIGVAKTGSGKTLAYVWPMIIHVASQRKGHKGEGPIGLVLAPTRQLCQQIYLETKKYTRKYEMKIGCLLGGENKHEQWKILRAGVDILIASPGRLIEMIKKKATNMQRVTYIVLDEADKMLSLGFQHQIRSIVTQTRPDRQTLLFTATMKQQIQFLAYDILESPIRILCGEQNAANQNIKQEVVIIEQQGERQSWLRMHLGEILQEGKVLIFCNQKQKCEQVKQFIEQNFLGIEVLTLYGDKTQYERTIIMNSFKGTSPILIATDIASRGIDVKAIKTVLNYQCPKTIEAYIHRIGRAGRAGDTGTAVSFLDKKSGSIKFSIQLVKIFQNSGYPVTKQLEDLACMDDFYRRKRISSKMGVSFAKGKDASKFLNQILKQQQRGNSKAGIGMNENLGVYKVKGKNRIQLISVGMVKNQNQDQENGAILQKSIAEILKEKGFSGENLSMREISMVIREQKQKKERHDLSSAQLKNHFLRSTQNQWNS